MTEALVIAAPACALLTGAATWLARTARQADLLNSAGAVLTALLTLALAGIALTDASHPRHGAWWMLDAAGGVFLAVIAVIGLLSALVAPSQLASSGRGLVRAARGRGMYYAAYHTFWAALIVVPLVDNLGLAWLLVEATTGASALLVAYSGTRGALEAGWKYLVLTTFGLAIAMLGIIVLYVAIAPGDGTLGTLDWQSIARAAPGLRGGPAVVAFVLIVAGLATKVGWAPVHNWLPDAHSEAPPPVSALLSAALLPTVVLVTWRVLIALGPALTPGTASALVLAFGLVSLAVAVPFLWRSMAWKRLLAYSSLEHMGILAVGIGFATPLATAGVVVHVAGHALAKSLGFYAAAPLLRHAPRAHDRAVRGLAFANPSTAGAVGVSLGALAAMPPSPLFISELLILLGGVAAHEIAVTVAAALLLALGFLGLAQALVDGLVGEPRVRRWRSGRSGVRMRRLTLVCGTLLLALTAVACLLPGSGVVTHLMAGIA
ncbi:MAG TPA: proton-conducting transporter membrane subunit [Solirubrobacteraceae bacterium]